MAGNTVFGVTPWGRWFVDALEHSRESARLVRGRSYATTGKVSTIEFEGRRVVARVKGHSLPFYTVRIDFPDLAEKDRERLFAAIESDPLLLTRIEAGEFPEELIELLKQTKIKLFPETWSSMRRSCTCPDWGDPCKHMAAVYYVIAREMDRDPSIIFKLRGLDLTEHFGRAKTGTEVHLPFDLELDASTRSVPPDKPPEPPRLGNYLGFVSSLIPPRPAFAAFDFAAALVEFYHRAAKETEPPPAADSLLERRFSASSFRLEIAAKDEKGIAPAALRSAVVVTNPDGWSAAFAVPELFTLFLSFEDDRGTPEYRFFFHLARFAFAAFHASAYAPAPCVDDKNLTIIWVPLRASADFTRALAELGSWDPGVSRVALGRHKSVPLSGASAAQLLASVALTGWVRRLGFRPTGERASIRPFVDLFFAGGTLDIEKPGERTLPRAIESWVSLFNLDFTNSAYTYRFTIREIFDDGSTAIDRFSVGLSVLYPAGTAGRIKTVTFKNAAAKLGTLEVLKLPTALAAYVPEIKRLSTQSRVVLDGPRLAAFLGEASPILRRLGVEVVLPKELSKALKPRLVLHGQAKGKRPLKTYLDLNTMLRYDWRVAIGDQILTAEEFERLVKGKRGIVLFRDGFIQIDPEEAARLLERAKLEALPSALEVVASRLLGEAAFDADAEELAASLFSVRDESLPAGLKAVLRPYQERGYRWAMSNLRSGFGCLLADDMGLGKTVQAIAVILRLREEQLLSQGALVIAPAALMTNWEREIGRFAPDLRVVLYHGKGRSVERDADVFLTTYDTATRDAEKLGERGFSLLVCDEAQLMKNAETRRSRGVKSIPSSYRLALSGTPVENRLEDLRSIFDVVLPGYLGGPKEFTRRWRVKIEVDRDAEAAEQLRRITSPFLMRRLKTDKSIVSDLPEKIVSDEYANLVPEQAALYEGIVQASFEKADAAETPFELSAVILSLLTSLKQVCDHPRVYDKESPGEASLSGKCMLLLELLGEILDRREKVLVFSQFVEMLELLKTIIRDKLGETCLVYHGGMAKKKRDEVVDAFQNRESSRVMLVSLKAGGLGLNLTAASRVIHYDLWYNPAVENQATDRTYRIGQTKNVFVHRLISSGTFEEKIDAMIKAKRELADMSIASGESWIANMSVEELRSLFARD